MLYVGYHEYGKCGEGCCNVAAAEVNIVVHVLQVVKRLKMQADR